MLLLDCSAWANAQGTGTVEIEFVEKDQDETLPCRVQVLDAKGRPMRARGGLFQSGWNLIESSLLFKGRPGDYTYKAWHGPQFAAGSGGFTLDKKSNGYDLVELPRHADLEQEGWYGGDLLSLVSAEKTLRWLGAEDLQMAVAVRDRFSETLPPVKTNEIKWVDNSSYWDHRPGSGLIVHHWHPPAEVPAELPSTRLLVMAKKQGQDGSYTQSSQPPVHAEIQRLWARDVPIWLASQHIDSVQVLSEHLTLDGKAPKVVPVVDPDPGRFRGALGPGRLVEYLYWQILESGLRIPPSAGSGFGRNGSPLGYNRVYVSHGSRTSGSWWKALQAGTTFVTNGPLLRVRVNEQLPGSVFTATAGQSVELDIALILTVADPVEYLEVVFNGQSLYRARLDEYAKQGGKIPRLSVQESGWLIVRVVTERAHTYRFAMTAPYYIEIGDTPRISRQAIEFFRTWLEKSAEQISASPQATTGKPYVLAARKYWSQRLQLANVP